MNIERPDNLFEQVSYDLNKFRERRVADRRFQARGTVDRRVRNLYENTGNEPLAHEMQSEGDASLVKSEPTSN
jgi:hypothetical protein